MDWTKATVSTMVSIIYGPLQKQKSFRKFEPVNDAQKLNAAGSSTRVRLNLAMVQCATRLMLSFSSLRTLLIYVLLSPWTVNNHYPPLFYPSFLNERRSDLDSSFSLIETDWLGCSGMRQDEDVGPCSMDSHSERQLTKALRSSFLLNRPFTLPDHTTSKNSALHVWRICQQI